MCVTVRGRRRAAARMHEQRARRGGRHADDARRHRRRLPRSGAHGFAQGIQVAAATQRPLYRYRPGDPVEGSCPTWRPALPVVSDDGRTITVRLRRGVRFSPPVNREVHVARRRLRVRAVLQRQRRWASTRRTSAIWTARRRRRPSGVRPISGITTPDAHTIVFRLRAPTPATFIGALTLPASAPVPEEYARPFDAASPSTYNTHVVATGPYMVRNDAAGNTVGYQPGRLDRAGAQPELAPGDRSRGRRTWTPSGSGPTRATQRGGAPGARGQAHGARPSRRRRRSSSGSCRARRPGGPGADRAATASCRSTRRSSRSTGSTCARRSSRSSIARPLRQARGGADDRAARDALPSAGHPGLRGGRRVRGAGRGLPVGRRPGGDVALAAPVHEQGRVPDREVHRRRDVPGRDGQRAAASARSRDGRRTQFEQARVQDPAADRARPTRCSPTGARSRPSGADLRQRARRG